MNVTMNERWLSVAEIAAHLGVNPDTIYKWIVRKGLPGHKVGRLWKFMISEVDGWVRDGKGRTEPSQQRIPQTKDSFGMNPTYSRSRKER